MRVVWLLEVVVVICLGTSAVSSSPIFPTLDQRVMFGYQGWFGATGDGVDGYGWRHWAKGSAYPVNHHLAFDLWPDTSEYSNSSLFNTQGLHYKSGDTAYLYSASVPATVDLHFKWLRDYGLDGVFPQRFLSENLPTNTPSHHHFLRVLQSIMTSSVKYNRSWAVMYDLSGYNSHNAGKSVLDGLKSDWSLLRDTVGVLKSPTYQHHDGKPVVTLWGIGLDDKAREPSTPQEAAAIAEYFKSEGCYVIAGTGYWWRTGSHDSKKDWSSAYAAFDLISPWAVGRYNNASFAGVYESTAPQDWSYLKEHKQGYAPVIWPGFSWYNLKSSYNELPRHDGWLQNTLMLKSGSSPLNQIPRFGGEFFRQQANKMLGLKPTFVYIAMFDEVNEGTAMLKAVTKKDQTPQDATFLYLDIDGDQLTTDFYLRLAQNLTRDFAAD